MTGEKFDKILHRTADVRCGNSEGNHRFRVESVFLWRFGQDEFRHNPPTRESSLSRRWAIYFE